MSESKQSPEKWRAEELRAQRKARLARMKSKDGGKKPIKTRNTLVIVIVIAVLVLAVLAGGGWAMVRLGYPQRMFTALTVGEINIKPVELSYYYYSTLNYYGIDPESKDGQDTLNGVSSVEGFATIGEMLKDNAFQQVQTKAMLAAKAAETGLKLDAEDNAQIESVITSVKNAATQNNTTVDNYLISYYGTGMNLDSYKAILERYILADKYAIEKKASFVYASDAVKTYYESHKDDYDVVDYRSFLLETNTASDATAEVIAKAKADTKSQAEGMLALIKDEKTFKDLCFTYAAEADKESFRTADLSLATDKYKSKTDAAYAGWLFDATRKNGDKTVIESSSGYYVVYFINRSQATFKHVNVRHILINAEESSATAVKIAEAKAKAESILAGFKAGAQTEEAFAALAKTNSADGNASTGGLYENVGPGEMVENFNNWCYDPTRKTGDAGIVQTEYGFHVMYFAGFTDKSDWEIKVEATLRDSDYSTFFTEELKKYPYKTVSFGMRFFA